MPNIFDHLKNITTNKGDYLGDEGWNNWMINRYLSMDENYCELVNIVQKNTWQMKGEFLYNLYKDIIPKKYVFLKYIKAKNKKEYKVEEINAVAEYYQISKKEAKEYLDVLNKDFIEKLMKNYGKL